MLSQNEIRALRERWGQCRNFSLRNSLAVSGPAHPFGKTECGLEDYRGFMINESLHKMTLEGIDFSYCTLGKGQFVSNVRRCLFVGAAIEGNIGETFEDCDFSHTNLRNAILRGAFTQCLFVRANLSLVRSSQAMFAGCTFDDANMRKGSLFGCRFVRCSFVATKFGSGSLADSVFEDCRFYEPDFSKVVLDGTKGLELYIRP